MMFAELSSEVAETLLVASPHFAENNYENENKFERA